MNQRNIVIAIAIVVLATHVVIFSDLPLIWRTAAVLILTGLLPGLLLVDWIVGHIDQTLSMSERLLYGLGVGYACIVLIMLGLSYLPGGIARWHTFLAFDLLLVVLLLRRVITHRNEPATALTNLFTPFRQNVSIWPVVGLLLLALVGGYLRFIDLSYSEFQGDEARAMLRAAETIQGHPDALLGHKKGPTEIVLPTVIYSMLGRIDEATARLPFAIANFAALFALFLLGQRLFGDLGGWSAAMLLAVDGYFIGFAHIVQYQSVVFLMVVLVVLIFSRLTSEFFAQPFVLRCYFMLAALLLGTGLLSHYEAVFVIFPCLYLLYRIWQNGVSLSSLLSALLLPILVGALIVASFYIPFVLNPNFAITYAYISVNRIGGSFPYNNLVDVFERTMLYSSSYYFFTLVGLAVGAVVLIYWRGLVRPWRTLVIALFLAGVMLTILIPDWLTISTLPEESNDYTWIFFAFILLLAWFLPNFPTEERVAWIWFGAPMILSLFFVRTPNTHVYGFFIGWALVAGLMLSQIWRWLQNGLGRRMAMTIGIPVAVSALLLFGTYEYWYFSHTDVEILRTWRENRPRGYWVPYEMPTNMSIFGFPFRNGWKTVGVLYEEGLLEGAFETNGRDAVSDWYTRGRSYCPRDHKYFIFSHAVEPAEADGLLELQQGLEEEYQLFGTVQVNGQQRLHIYQRDIERSTNDAPSPQMFVHDEYQDAFDERLAGPTFERSGSIAPALAEQTIQHPLDLRFGDSIWLKGYRVNATTVQPRRDLVVTLYWQSAAPVERAYTAFNQIIDPSDFRKAGQRDGEPVCNRRPTNSWLPNELIADRHWVSVFPDAIPGTYTLLIGLYDRETGERLPISTRDDQPMGDSLVLTEIVVE
ncbi:glycosyltransferase family 39 protein [Chloroflexi bacterium TSY]|nr:glycosyltransferase family 39 protein [Chloroflexi bacterium TSY]